MVKHIYLGLDVGSTTVKQVCLDSKGNIIFSNYERHFSDVRNTLGKILQNIADAFPNATVFPAITGSAGMSLANNTGIPFIQEVIASTISISRKIPSTDVAIELGGEDAKITFFDGSIDQRMNETCAGGTGAFIDQMASYLQTDAAGLNQLAKNYQTIYPIAARCGVFAKTDIMPLLNEGAAREDIAASIFQAVVDQTIGGLACGKAIVGNIAFLGGPLFFLSELRQRFIQSLDLKDEQVIFPEQAHFFVALGAALEMAFPSPNSPQPIKTSIDQLIFKVKNVTVDAQEEQNILPALFNNNEEFQEFKNRHSCNKTPRRDIITNKEDIFIGFDIGSTTIKSVVIDADGALIHSFYEHSQGEPLAAAVSMLKNIYKLLPPNTPVTYSGATGYGGGLIRSALGADIDEVETIAHFTATQFFYPNVSFILDIGGQDMKCLHISNGVIDRVILNEACSAGCGVFIETFAKSLGMDNEKFIKKALTSKHPVDLGSRCTVFMNSKVKQAQKEGASVGDIAAGLAYSVVRNALYKVIKTPNIDELGNHLVVQGGAFLNDALLRALEIHLGKDIFRPDISGLMGAYGMALLAKKQYRRLKDTNQDKNIYSSLLGKDDLEKFSWKTHTKRCKICGNNCLLTLNTFNDGRQFTSGNRCERGLDKKNQSTKKKALNLYAYKYKRIFDYKSLEKGFKGTIGIPRVLNMYENYPFWFTFFTKLGYRVELSSPSTKKLYALGLSTIPSQTACFPAKLAHGHILDLINKGIKDIFYPCIPLENHEYSESDGNFNCPVVSGYPELLRLNLDSLSSNQVTLHTPFLPLDNMKRLTSRLVAEIKNFPHSNTISKKDIAKAVDAAYQESEKVSYEIKAMGEQALQTIEKNGELALVLAGHPYHIDPGVHHGIPDIITKMGVTVLTEDSVAHLAPEVDSLRVVNQWTYHARLYKAALFASSTSNVGLLQLTSFGCGLDAITSDQVQEIMEYSGRIYNLLKIDEGANLGSARIRIRSLLAAEEAKREKNKKMATSSCNEVNCSCSCSSSSHPIVSHSKESSLIPFDTSVDTKKEKALDPLFQSKSNVYTPKQRVPFTESMRTSHTILIPQLSPIHFRFVEKTIGADGYNVTLLPNVDSGAVETGLKHINNDVCFPAQMAVGQLLQAVQSGEYDTNSIALMISQTGGGCRASNYISFLRKALEDTGFSHIPVISFNMSGMEDNPGFTLSKHILKRLIRGSIYGDLLAKLYYSVRPYEKNKGDADRVLEEQTQRCLEVLLQNDKKTFIRRVDEVIIAFDDIPTEGKKRPKVGIVGEIYLKFNPYSNNNIMDTIESEGGEAVPGEIVYFILYCLYDDIFKASHLSGNKISALKSRFFIWWIENLRNIVRKALSKYPRFGQINHISTLAEKVSSIISLGHQTGEGWLLTAEMIELIESGNPNIICLQPFACLPNHITGKGMIKEMKRRYPMANIVAIDYDAGASQVNQLNRIKLMMAVAHRNHTR